MTSPRCSSCYCRNVLSESGTNDWLLALRRNVRSTRFTFWSLLSFRWNRSSYCGLSQNHSPPLSPSKFLRQAYFRNSCNNMKNTKTFSVFSVHLNDTLWVETTQPITNKCNIEVRWRNHCCSGKAISITYSECVSAALVIQHTRRIVFCGLSGTTIFLHIIS